MQVPLPSVWWRFLGMELDTSRSEIPPQTPRDHLNPSSNPNCIEREGGGRCLLSIIKNHHQNLLADLLLTFSVSSGLGSICWDLCFFFLSIWIWYFFGLFSILLHANLFLLFVRHLNLAFESSLFLFQFVCF